MKLLLYRFKSERMNKTKTTIKHNRESARVATVHRHTAAQILQTARKTHGFQALVINRGGVVSVSQPAGLVAKGTQHFHNLSTCSI